MTSRPRGQYTVTEKVQRAAQCEGNTTPYIVTSRDDVDGGRGQRKQNRSQMKGGATEVNRTSTAYAGQRRGMHGSLNLNSNLNLSLNFTQDLHQPELARLALPRSRVLPASD